MERTVSPMNILEIVNPLNSTIIIGGLAGFMIGYFILKIKVILFALGGVLSLIMYLQYQGLISVNVDKVQHFTYTLTNSVANSTMNILSYQGNNFTITPFWIPDLIIPFAGSMAVGITAGLMRG
jgi:uncharacterized membrane protein (Fun14 family)